MTLLDDVAAEHAALAEVVAGLDDRGWRTATPADGWDIRDSIAHLAWSDELADIALTDAARFAAIAADPTPTVAAWIERGRSLPGPAVLAWWREAQRRTLDALEQRAADDRVPWGAGPMSPASFATARLMETWAHGQDVRDALGLPAAESDRLRHVADLGVRTRSFSYRVRGLEPPAGDIRVDLLPPDGGDAWCWGAGGGTVSGPALDFCLVVTQRRHVDDTRLTATATARDWLLLAQAFAGPPTGPRPARFR